MEIESKLVELLRQTMLQDRELTAWRFNLYDTQGLEVGLKNNQIGGPYSAPSFKRSINGELYLIWANQRFTAAKLDSQTVESFAENLALWKTTAYYDGDGVGLFNPEQIPQVVLADAQVQQIVAGDFQFPFDILNRGLQRLQEFGMKKVDGKVQCYMERRILKNSDGLTVDYLQTPVVFYFEVNDAYGESFQEKRLPVPAEIERMIENTGRIGRQLLTPDQTEITGPIQLILPPEVFESFTNHFLITNLAGSLVVNRQSSFTLADFYHKRPVLRDDLTLEINTLLPLKSFSYPCTTEAVPGGSVELISDGRAPNSGFKLEVRPKNRVGSYSGSRRRERIFY